MSTTNMYNKMFKKYPDTFSIKELREILGIGKNLAYQLIKEGKIKHIRVGRKIVITKISVIDYLINVKS